MPPKGKTKSTPNQHDKRHENGLAPPGKRVTKQRSSGQLNGHLNGSSPPPLPSTGLNQGFKFPLPATDANHHPTTARTTGFSSSSLPPVPAANPFAIRDHGATAVEESGRDRTSSDVSLEDVGPYGEMMDGGYEHSTAMLIGEAHSATACKSRSLPYAAGPFSTVSTILANYPLRDAISILILLLALPPSLVVVVQFLFASLTFVPPTAGLSLSTLPNFKEIFNSSNVGYPALATLGLVDLLFWILWLPLWRPLQGVVLDMSQVVIAISLSGAAASTGGPTYGIASCALAVCMVHVLRYRAIHLTALDYLRSVIHKMDIDLQFDVPSFAAPFFSSPSIEWGWPFTILRTILGLHIFAQGITTCIRRTLVQANEKENVLATPKIEADLPTLLESAVRSSTNHADAVLQPHTTSSSDGRPPGPSPAARDRLLRDSGNKRKRKQAHQVRSQQPLWAAIASTKVTFVKEMEQRDAADDAREAVVMDNKTKTTTTFVNTINTATTNRLWICEVRDTEIHFRVQLGMDTVVDTPANDENTLPAGIDQSKPFFVRINSATWSSTRIGAMTENDQSKQGPARHFFGEIFGLAPMSNYHCEIVSLRKMQVLCTASLITQLAPSAEQTHAAVPSTQHQTLRPSSPRTTLKQSIQSAEVKLNEICNRAKKSKRDQRAAHTQVRNEIGKLRGSMDVSSATDERNDRRLQQISQHRKQAEEAIAELRAQIDGLGDIPSNEQATHQSSKSAHQAALNAQKSTAQEVKNVKTDAERELAAVRTEISSAKERKERLNVKIAQRAQEHEKLVAKQQADLMAKQKREQDRSGTLEWRRNKEAEIRHLIASADANAQTHSRKAQETWQELTALSNWFPQQAANGYSGFGTPPTPEGTVSGLAGGLASHVNGNTHSAYAQQGFQPSFPVKGASSSKTAHVSAGPGPRGRSSSMLSQYSGFTDDGDDLGFEPQGALQNAWAAHRYTNGGAERKTSDGEGSETISGGASLTNGSTGSTNGSNSPRPDAKPFVPATVKSPGTLGSSNKQISRSPTLSNAGTNGKGR